jgi:glyoxylase-like metal-dependent hydrolase (beta-lactamase superfamily II)/rhodanese-related sulfurtransferase
MILRQFYLSCLAHASYLVADPVTRVAAVVDPQRDIQQYLDAAAQAGVAIRHVVLTHFHADFVAGHLELRDRCGAEIHLGAAARAGYAFTPAADGDDIVLGAVKLRVLATPGHTPEGITLLVHAGDPAHPRAALTGDTLFIGDVGRPDLLASAGSGTVDAAALAGALHDSLGRLLALPDDVLVYPAHGAGSLCGRNLAKETVSTIGEQRRGNHALQPMARERFIALVTSDLPPAPPYFAHDVALNRDGHATVAAAAPGLELAAAIAARAAGAQVLDVRDATAFAGAHWAGSVNVGLRGQFATWAGSVLDPARAVIVVAEPGQEAEAALRLGRIGFDRVAGHLAGGMAALAGRPDLIASATRVAPGDLAGVLRAPGSVLVDVRAPGEFAHGAIPGAVNIPLQELPRRLAEVPAGPVVVVHCAAGYRSSAAASLLAAHGRRVADLIGGYAAWKAVAA